MANKGRGFLDGTVTARRVTFFVDQETVDFLKTIPGPNGNKGNMSMGLRTVCKDAKAMAEAFAKHLNDEKTR